MRIEKDKYDNTYYLHLSENCFVHTQNDWKQIFGKWNWYTFHFAHIYFEKDIMTRGYEFEFILLGFGFRFRYNYDPTFWEEKTEEINKELENAKN